MDAPSDSVVEHETTYVHANIPTATGKANADGATATPTASKVPIADSGGELATGWVKAATTSAKGAVVLPNASGFAPMPLNAGVMITPSTTGLTVGQDGPYRSDGAFTLPAGGTWEYYIEQTASPIVGKGPGIAKTINGTEVIKHIGDNYFVTATELTATIYIYRWENGGLTQVTTYVGPASTGIVVLQEWDGSTARLALFTGNLTTCTVYVFVFNGTTITLESTNTLPIGISNSYTSGTALTATRVAFICGGSTATNRNTLYVYDYDTSAQTWAQVGTALSLTVGYRCGICKVQDSTTDIIIMISPNTLARYTFNGSTWSLVGTGYSVYTNHGISGSVSFCLPLGNNRWLVGFLGTTSPTLGIVLWWDSTNSVFRPMSPVLKLRASSTNYSAWGYGLSTLLSFDANDNKVYPYFFPAGELTTRFAGVAAGGTTVAPAEIATSYRGRVWRVQ